MRGALFFNDDLPGSRKAFFLSVRIIFFGIEEETIE